MVKFTTRSARSGSAKATVRSQQRRRAVRAAIEALEDRQLLSYYSVTTTGDTAGTVTTAGLNGTIGQPYVATTLRAAITAANANGVANNIVFSSSMFSTAQTIRLTSMLPIITNDLTITGMGENLLTISGDANDDGINDAGDVPIFDLTQGQVTLSDMTLSGGRAQGGTGGNGGLSAGGGGGGGGFGGAIFLDGAKLTLKNDVLSSNEAIGGTGGNGGNVTHNAAEGSSVLAGDSGAGGGVSNSSTSGPAGVAPTGNGANGSPPTAGSPGTSGGDGEFGQGGGGGGAGGVGGANLTVAATGGSGGNGGQGGYGGFGGGAGGGGGGGAGGVGGPSPTGTGNNGGQGGNSGNGAFGGQSGSFGGQSFESDARFEGDLGFDGLGGGGFGTHGGAGGGGAGLGGAIFINSGTLEISNTAFNLNQALGGSGGADFAGHAESGQGKGGGIFINGGTVMATNDDSFTGNIASNSGTTRTDNQNLYGPNPFGDGTPTDSNDAYSTLENTTLNVPAISGVLANDEIPDADATKAALGTGVQHGTLSLNSDGSFSYVPTTGYSGHDSFTYNASDYSGHVAAAAATVTLTINETPSLIVTTTQDVVNSTDGLTSLREAISYAETLTGPQTITFASSLTSGGPATITLAGTELDIAESGTLTITGPGANLLTVNANSTSRVFDVSGGGTVSINGLTLTGGNTDVGGGIYNNATTLNLNADAIIGNTATSFGGGLASPSGDTVTITNSTFSNNTAGNEGGAIEQQGVGSSPASLMLTNCTISGNTANGSGLGAISNVASGATATLTVQDCTIAGNTGSASYGGGIFNAVNSGSAIATYTATIFANNQANIVNLGGTVTSLGHNLSSDGTGSLTAAGDLPNTNPLLAPRGNYGGPTQTMPPLPGSPAIGTGVSIATATTDQRGVTRPGSPDIGAVQTSGYTITVTPAADGQSTPVNTAFANPLQVTVKASNSSDPVAGGIVSYGVPGSGASATLSSPTATIASNGTASVTATANGTLGSYVVTAAARGASLSQSFHLNNTEAPSLVVNTSSDTVNPNDGLTSLREAISYAETLTGPQTITFASSLTSGGPATITLAGTELDIAESGTLTITGPGANLLTVNANSTSRVFDVSGGGTVSINGLTLTGGNTDVGGGIYNNATTLNLNADAIIGNTATSFGGGLASPSGDTVTITNSTFSNNTAGNEGGAIEQQGVASSPASMTLTNCTISGNTADGGGFGAISNVASGATATLTVQDCTIAGNTGSTCGGIFNAVNSGSAIATYTGTIFANNQANIVNLGSVTSLGHNLSSDGTGSLTATGDLSNTNPLLAALGNYGGPTQTMPPLPGSPAIGTGVSIVTATTDQRGVTRPGSPDIGAVQTSGYTIAATAADQTQSALINAAFANPLQVTVKANNPNDPVAGGVISYTVNPVSGAAATLSTPTATIQSDGTASITATANGTAGSYTVNAGASGIATPAQFSLTNINNQNDLSVTITDNDGGSSVTSTSGDASPGASIIYTVVVTNAGPSTATNILVSDPVPSGLSSMLWSGDGQTAQSGAISDTIASLAANASVTYTITGFINSGATGTLTNTATVSAANDPNPANNSATDSDTLIPQANLSLSMTDNDGGSSITNTIGSAVPGNPITYTIVLDNTGPGNAYNVTLADTLPAALTNVTAPNPPLGVTFNPVTDTFAVGSLASGASLTFTVSGTISATATGTLTNSVSATSSDATTSTAVDTDTLTIVKKTLTLSAAAGQTVVIGSGALMNATAMLAGGTAESGKITFTLYNPSGTLVDTETANVSGNGTYSTPMGYLPTTAGTYQWVASYGGDTNDNPVSTTKGAASEVAVGAGATVVGTTLYLVGGNSNDLLTLTPVGTSHTGSTGLLIVGLLNKSLTINSTYKQTISSIVIYGFNGNDTIAIAPTITISTTVVEGTGNDGIALAAGNNTVTVAGGNLTLIAGDGANIITFTGTGNDWMQLGSGANNVALGNGNDTIIEGNGNDTVVAGNGNDSVTLGNGASSVMLGGGNNSVNLGNGNNSVAVGNGSNSIALGSGANTVHIGTGSNSVVAGNGNDSVIGATSGTSADTIQLGNGNDTVNLANGSNTVTVGSGTDSITVGNGNNVVVGGTGSDTILAGSGDNFLIGGLGHDSITAGNGSNIFVDGTVTLTQRGDSLQSILAAWIKSGKATSNVSNIRSRMKVTDNTTNSNTLTGGSGLDWFWYTDKHDVTNAKASDLHN